MKKNTTLRSLQLLGIGLAGLLPLYAPAQNTQVMTPELLWKLGRVSAESLSPDGKTLIYGVSNYDLAANKGERNLFSIPVAGGPARQISKTAGSESVIHISPSTGRITYLYKAQLWEMNADGSVAKQLTNYPGGLSNVRFSPDRKHILFSGEVPILNTDGKDRYPDLKQSNAQVYDDLDYRHWDTWEDGKFQHIFYAPYTNGIIGKATDIMKGEPFDCPQMPFGGSEDAIWSPDGTFIVYVTKKKFGKSYALSTNTDLYFYNLATGITTNFTENIKGYDTAPAFSKDGSKLAWLSMDEDGFEADKNDLMVYDFKTLKTTNLSKDWDETISSFTWSNNGNFIYYLAATGGTEQVFTVDLAASPAGAKNIKQLTAGQFDINGITGQSANSLVVSRADINHAAEIYTVDLGSGATTKLTGVNDAVYNRLSTGLVSPRHTAASDGKDLFSWVIYPPGFDPSKKYPTLLYCQGGPQSALTQFYSFRWNLQLIAANGYIVIAPNRRGMPGHGIKWNDDISGDWGGQPIRDYLSAIDDLAREPYVDKTRIGAVGASYGGYSIYMLAGVHENRFKTFIAHDGLFDVRSWFGTTEELWFANKDIGGPYWGANPPAAYKKFNPIEFADKWNTPIMIVQGGKDYRVPVEQGLEAFQLAQLKGIKSRLLYLPDENHWVTSPQNGLVWQREFFKWLKETL